MVPHTQVEGLPMKVCFIAFHDFKLFPRAFNEIETLVDNGFAVEVVGFDKSRKLPMNEKIGKVRIFRARPKFWIDAGLLNVLDFFPAFSALFSAALKSGAKTYHCYDLTSLLACSVVKIFRRYDKKIIYDAYENWPELISNSPNFLRVRRLVGNVTMLIEVLFVRLADYVLTIDSVDNELLERYRMFNGNVEVLLNVPKLNLPTEGKIQEEFTRNYAGHDVIVSVGAIAKHVGILKAVMSIKIVKEKIPNVKLLIAGGSGYSYENKEDKDEILGYIKKHKLESYVEFVGPVPYSRILNFLHVAKVCLMLYQPTPWLLKYSKSSSKLFLYMLSSKPLVASKMPIAQIAEDEQCGILVDPTNPQEIANAIIYLLENPVKAKLMGEKGKKAVLMKYNWNIFSERLLGVYERMRTNVKEKPSARCDLSH